MKMMKQAGVMVLVILAGCLAALAQSGFVEDFEQAKAAAKQQGKFMLLNFTGSDWCGWCIKLDKEVFSKNEFKKYAKDNLICVSLDYPHGKKPPKKIQEQNEALKNQFGIRGYPTIILLDPNGEKIAQTGYKEGGAEGYVRHVEELIAPHKSKAALPDAAMTTASATVEHTLRTWTSATGTKVEATFNKRTGNIIELRRANGSLLRIDLAALSEADQNYLQSVSTSP